jgi:hypothetical protein
MCTVEVRIWRAILTKHYLNQSHKERECRLLMCFPILIGGWNGSAEIGQ